MAARGARVVGLDITHRMVELARMKRPADPHTRFLTGDMMYLPFQGASFNVVTTGYGLRNVPEITGALHEIHRVLTPGGLMVSLDFNRPENAMVRTLYLGYLAAIGSALGRSCTRIRIPTATFPSHSAVSRCGPDRRHDSPGRLLFCRGLPCARRTDGDPLCAQVNGRR